MIRFALMLFVVTLICQSKVNGEEFLKDYFLNMSVSTDVLIGVPEQIKNGEYRLKIKTILFSKTSLKEEATILFYNSSGVYSAVPFINKKQLFMLNYDSKVKKYFLRPYILGCMMLEEFNLEEMKVHRRFKEFDQWYTSIFEGFTKKDMLEFSILFSKIIENKSVQKVDLIKALKKSQGTSLVTSVREAFYSKGYYIRRVEDGGLGMISKQEVKDAYKIHTIIPLTKKEHEEAAERLKRANDSKKNDRSTDPREQVK